MMRPIWIAAIAGSWPAFLAGLILPLPLALFGSGVSSDALTPLFYALWAVTSIGMYALRSARRMARASLNIGGMLTLLASVFGLLPPHDGLVLQLSAGAVPLAALQWWVAQRLSPSGRLISTGGSS